MIRKHTLLGLIATGGNGEQLIQRLNADLTVDATFGNSGIVQTLGPVNGYNLRDLTVFVNGNIQATYSPFNPGPPLLVKTLSPTGTIL